MFFTAGLTSCGLDTFYLLKGPLTFINRPEISNITPDNNFVEFETYENQNLPGDFSFTGTVVYYKIYASKDTATSDINTIDSKNNDSNYGAAAELLLSKGYKELRTDTSGDSAFLIANTGTTKRVKIRLTDYNLKSDLNPAADTIASIYINNVDIGQKPRRCETVNRKNLKFNFGRSTSDDESPLPDSNDVDFDHASVSDGMYYVNMYALAIGHDVTFKNYYSNVLYLGTIKICSSSENNWN